jgi:dienelactone hydrolase
VESLANRNDILKCLGDFPQKCALDMEVIKTIQKGTHTLQLVQYAVEQGERINAWLLIPADVNESNPAIIAIHQHGGEFYLGKSEPAGLTKNRMYHYGLDLCLRGYVVLCPDHLGFEDRRPTEYERHENAYLQDGGYERFLFCKYISEGSTLQAKYLWDLSRGIDLLQSLDYVDNNRIGAIGHSLGGQETLWLTWFDERIKAAVCSCGIGQLKTIFREKINHNFAMFTFGLSKICDIGDLVCDIAPRPFMMSNGYYDSLFPIDGVEEIIKQAKRKYQSLQAEEHFCSVVFEDGHSFPDDVKIKAYEWLDKFIMHK